MSRGIVVLLLVSAFWGAAIGSFQLQNKLSKSLQTTQVLSDRILALGAAPDGTFHLIPVAADGTLPVETREWDFYLTEERLGLFPRSMDGAGEVWLDSIETHNSRRGRTVKLTLSSPGGVTVCIYEGALGKVIPKQRAVLARADLNGVLFGALGWGLVSMLLAFTTLLLARTLLGKRALKDEIASS